MLKEGEESAAAAREVACLINGVSHHACLNHTDKLPEVVFLDRFWPADVKVIRLDGHTDDAGMLVCHILGDYRSGDPWCLQSRQCTSVASVE